MRAIRLGIQDISKKQQSEIDSLIGESFFASYGFLQLWESMQGSPCYWIVEENNTILCLLPAVEFGNGKLKRLQVLPDGCYGSLFFTDGLNKEQCENILFDAINTIGYQKVYMYNFYGTIQPVSKYEILLCQTTLVDISSSDWQPPDKKLQSEIRKAEREQVEVIKFESKYHFEKFMLLMEQTEKRHNRTPKYSETFFRTLAELAEVDNRILWYWCEYEGQAVSSHINFIDQKQVLNWQVYFDKSFSRLKANQKMLFDLAAFARKNNIRYLNLGASPLESSSLIEYKEKWGGEIKEYSCYIKKSLLGKIF